MYLCSLLKSELHFLGSFSMHQMVCPMVKLLPTGLPWDFCTEGCKCTLNSYWTRAIKTLGFLVCISFSDHI